MFEKLKTKWQIDSNIQLIIILVVFSITGSLSVFITKPILAFLGVSKEAFEGRVWLYWIIRILIIFPVYQILLVVVGTLFGQHKFFWNFEKKMLRRFGIKIK